MHLEHRPTLPVGDQPAERLALALALVDLAGLLAVLVHRQDKATVEQLLVDVHRGRGQEDRNRAPDAVGVRDQPAVVPSFPVEAIDNSPSDCRSLSA